MPIALAVYALGLLWPYEFRLPLRIVNHAVWTDAGTLRFDGPGLALSAAPPKWQIASREQGTFHVALRARSGAANQEGPARLLTLAQDTFVQNLMIGQLGDDLVVRLRGLCRGLPTHGRACPGLLRIPAVFATSEWVDIDLRVERARVTLTAGDRLAVERPLAEHAIRGWDARQRLALGNDVTGLRPWLGELASVTIDSPLGHENWLDPTRFELPGRFWLMDRQPKLAPFYHVSRKDVIVNILLYVPMALLVAARFHRYRIVELLATILIVLTISLSFEMMQLFVETRNFSLTDVMLNLGGGAVAAIVVYAFVRLRHARQAQQRP
jgi:VanZ family protein